MYRTHNCGELNISDVLVLFDEEDVMTANPSNVSYGGDTGILDGEADSWF